MKKHKKYDRYVMSIDKDIKKDMRLRQKSPGFYPCHNKNKKRNKAIFRVLSYFYHRRISEDIKKIMDEITVLQPNRCKIH